MSKNQEEHFPPKLSVEDDNETQEIKTTGIEDQDDENIHFNDFNAISLNRINRPLVVFFGPGAIGKTAVLLRLALYLKDKNFDVSMDREFWNDSRCEETADKVESLINEAQFAPDKTGLVNLALLNVAKRRGKILCSFLEAPGEHFFQPLEEEPLKIDYPPYLHDIISGHRDAVLYVFFLPADYKKHINPKEQLPWIDNYIERIQKFLESIKRRDKCLILFNKADLTTVAKSEGIPDYTQFKRDMFNYQKIKSLNQDIVDLGNSHRTLIPFSTGNYQHIQGREATKPKFTKSTDKYPEVFWKEIEEALFGSFWPKLFKTGLNPFK